MRKSLLLISPLLLLLQGCQTAPRVLMQAVCPAIPPLEQDAPGPDFTGPMQSFLRGNLPGPTSYELTLPGVKASTTPPGLR
jgi:hypothetical protein